MAQMSNRPSHDRSICLTDQENDALIRYIEQTNGVVCFSIIFLTFKNVFYITRIFRLLALL